MIDYENFFQFIKDKEGFKAVLGQTQSLALPVVSLSLADIWHVWIYTRENAPKRNPIMAEFLTKEGYKSLLREGGGDSHDGTYTQWCKHGTYAIRVFHDVSLEQQLRIEWDTPRPLNLFFGQSGWFIEPMRPHFLEPEERDPEKYVRIVLELM